MQMPTPRHESFVVRLSAEPQSEGIKAKWVLRGQVEHTLTGQSWRFVSLNELPRILEACLQEWLDGGDADMNESER